MYDPVTGRFLQIDPKGRWYGSNAGNGYLFESADPVNGLDPLGLQDTTPDSEERRAVFRHMVRKAIASQIAKEKRERGDKFGVVRAWRKGDRWAPRPRPRVDDGWGSFFKEVLLPSIFMLPSGGSGAVFRVTKAARSGSGYVGRSQAQVRRMKEVAKAGRKNSRVCGPRPRPARITRDGVGQSGQHVISAEARDSVGRLKSRGRELSGCDVAPGGTLSAKAQKSVHTEAKWLLKYAPDAEAGDYIFIQGRLAPCGHVGKTNLGCFKAMEDFAKSYKVWIDYFDDTGRSWSFGPKGFIKNPLPGF